MIPLAALVVSSGTATEVGALVVAAAALLIASVTGHKKADTEYVDRLEHRVSDAERRLTECEHARDALKEENLALMRKVLLVDAPPVVVLPATPPVERNHP